MLPSRVLVIAQVSPEPMWYSGVEKDAFTSSVDTLNGGTGAEQDIAGRARAPDWVTEGLGFARRGGTEFISMQQGGCAGHSDGSVCALKRNAAHPAVAQHALRQSAASEPVGSERVDDALPIRVIDGSSIVDEQTGDATAF